MGFTHLRSSEYLSMPWKGGGGVTEQIAIEPPGATLSSGFLWRLSMARVERSGPFSRFAGCDRTLLLLEGSGLDIAFGAHGNARLEEPFAPISFSGDWEARGTLRNGPVRDFNVISDRSRVRHDARVIKLSEEPIKVKAMPTLWIIGLSGECRITPMGIRLPPLDALRLYEEEIAVQTDSPGAHCLLVRFAPRSWTMEPWNL